MKPKAKICNLIPSYFLATKFKSIFPIRPIVDLVIFKGKLEIFINVNKDKNRKMYFLKSNVQDIT